MKKGNKQISSAADGTNEEIKKQRTTAQKNIMRITYGFCFSRFAGNWIGTY
jgi:hypothetical protein